MTWTNIPDAAITTNKPIKATTGRALRDNTIAVAEADPSAPRVESKGIVATEVEFTSSSTFNPAALSDYPEAVAHFHIWGGGGSGSFGSGSDRRNSGGGGGGYFYTAKKISDISGTVPVVVGAGGAQSGGAGNAGGQSYVTINGVNFGARGGGGGITQTVGTPQGGDGGGFFLGSLTFVPSTNESSSTYTAPPHLNSGGHGGIASPATKGGDAFYGGGGGGSTSRSESPSVARPGGVSALAGDGGDGSLTEDGGAGGFPAGGGGACSAASFQSGAGGDGLVLIEIIGMRS